MSKVRRARPGPPDRPVGPDKSLNDASPRERARLLRTGIWTAAEVVDAGAGTIAGDLGVWAAYVVHYRFAADGSPRLGHRNFGRSRDWHPGDRLDVWYDPADPDISVWPGAPWGARGDWLRGVVSGWRLVILVVVVAIGWGFLLNTEVDRATLAVAFLGSLAVLIGVTIWDFLGHRELAAATQAAQRRVESQLAEPPADKDRRTRRERRPGRAGHRRR